MRLQTDRPIVFFDIESTGLNVYRDRIVEISVVKLHPDGKEETKHRRLNPGIPISPEATAIHGISDADVQNAPSFRQVARSFFDFLEECDLAGFNISKFDIPILTEEFKRNGIIFSEADRRIVDLQKIYHRKEPRTLGAALRFYCNEEHTEAHGAEGDARACMRILEAQLERYPDVPRQITELHQYCNPPNPHFVDREGKLRWRNNDVIIGFGQKSGATLKYLVDREPEYLKWILRGNFSQAVKQVVEDALQGRFPEKNEKNGGSALQNDDPELLE